MGKTFDFLAKHILAAGPHQHSGLHPIEAAIRGRSTAARRSAHRFGRLAERLVRWWMICRGYRVVAVNFRTRSGEIDLIVRKRNSLAMVEIKARKDPSILAWTLPPKQRRRIERASAAFISRNPQLAHLDIRFDLVLVHRWPQHIPDAWRPDW